MKLVSAAWMVVLAVIIVATNVARAEGKKIEVSVKGTVVAKHDDELNVVGVTLKEEGGKVYNVTLDGKGKALGEQMDGAKVDAKGVVSKQGETQWITVKSYQAVKKDEAVEPEVVEAEPPTDDAGGDLEW